MSDFEAECGVRYEWRCLGCGEWAARDKACRCVRELEALRESTIVYGERD